MKVMHVVLSNFRSTHTVSARNASAKSYLLGERMTVGETQFVLKLEGGLMYTKGRSCYLTAPVPFALVVMLA